MLLPDNTLKQILLDENYVTPQEMALAQEYATDHKGKLTDYLISNNLLNHDLLGQAVAEHYKMPYYDLNTKAPPENTIKKLPKEIATNQRVIFLRETQKTVSVATDWPDNPNLVGAINSIFADKEVNTCYSLPDDIDSALMVYQEQLDTQIQNILSSSSQPAPDIIETITTSAHERLASDIHFEPTETEIVVRFRIDGVLHQVATLKKDLYNSIVNGIKLAANLRLDEHRVPQDGAMHITTKVGTLDLRVSIVPILDGEKVVIRVLSKYIREFSLSDIGLTAEHEKLINKAIQKPFGMIIVAGPTGAGKSTTLYSVLRTLNNTRVNITTIEDPVEYKIRGINQIQVNSQANLTFADGLRSIVRQDPDVILVGEIRDTETAEISVNAALTGHLLLSSFHANNAVTTIPRLIDMGIEPFLLASTLELIIAQRLVRKICESCRLSYLMDPSELNEQTPIPNELLKNKQITLFKGKGCTRCQGLGYQGRTGIFELIPISQGLRDLIMKNPSTDELTHQINLEGLTSLYLDGIAKALSGITTIEEVIRVANPT